MSRDVFATVRGLPLPKCSGPHGTHFMTLAKLSKILSCSAILAASALCPRALAQGPLPDNPIPSTSSALSSAFVEPVTTKPRRAEGRHPFWDTENRVLFATTAALAGADFAVTRSNLQNGGHELDPIVRFFGTSTPALAANFAGETAGVMTLAYIFHRAGHHKMERAVSLVNIGASTFAVTYGLTHR
jgi:hypothetical protein